jgi:hypothetical protein
LLPSGIQEWIILLDEQRRSSAETVGVARHEILAELGVGHGAAAGMTRVSSTSAAPHGPAVRLF